MAWLGLPRGRPALAGAGAVLVVARARIGSSRCRCSAAGICRGPTARRTGRRGMRRSSTTASGGSASTPGPRRARRRSRASPPRRGRCGCSSRATGWARASGSSSVRRSSSPPSLRPAIVPPRGLVGAARVAGDGRRARLGAGRPATSLPRGRGPCDRGGARSRRGARRAPLGARCGRRRAPGCARRVRGGCRPPRRGLRDTGGAGARAHRGADPLERTRGAPDRHVGGRARGTARRGGRPRRRVPRGRSPSARHAGRARRRAGPRRAARRRLRAAGRGCTPAEAWVRAHGTDVSRHLGQPSPGLAYDLSAGTRPGSRTSAAWRRSRRHR